MLTGTSGDQRREAGKASGDPGVSLLHNEVKQLQRRLVYSVEGPAVTFLPQVLGREKDRGVKGPPKLTRQPLPRKLPPVGEPGVRVWRHGLPADGMKEPVPNFPREHARAQKGDPSFRHPERTVSTTHHAVGHGASVSQQSIGDHGGQPRKRTSPWAERGRAIDAQPQRAATFQ